MIGECGCFSCLEQRRDAWAFDPPPAMHIPVASPREKLLDEAKTLITGARQVTYGPPVQNFEDTASILNTMGYSNGDRPLVASDVGKIMLALKLARMCNDNTTYDTLVDLAGYAANTWECLEQENG